MNIITLQTFSLAESKGNGHYYLFEILFEEQTIKAKWFNTIDKKDFSNMDVFFGGFPSVSLMQDIDYKLDWCASYVERDLRDLTKDMMGFYKLFQYVNFLSGQQWVAHALSADLGLDQRTVKRYIDILQMTYQIDLLPPFYNNHLKRLVKTSKMYVKDTGLLTYMMGISSWQQLENSHFKGAIFETWLYSQLPRPEGRGLL